MVVDEHGDSRGYGFVRFADETDQQRALTEMQGVIVGSKPIRVSIAAPKKYVELAEKHTCTGNFSLIRRCSVLVFDVYHHDSA